MKIQNSTDLKLLDSLVAEAQGWEKIGIQGFLCWGNRYALFNPATAPIVTVYGYNPTTNWQQCGELIDKFTIKCEPYDTDGNLWTTYISSTKTYVFDKDLKIAICRVIIISVIEKEYKANINNPLKEGVYSD